MSSLFSHGALLARAYMRLRTDGYSVGEAVLLAHDLVAFSAARWRGEAAIYCVRHDADSPLDCMGDERRDIYRDYACALERCTRYAVVAGVIVAQEDGIACGDVAIDTHWAAYPGRDLDRTPTYRLAIAATSALRRIARGMSATDVGITIHGDRRYEQIG